MFFMSKQYWVYAILLGVTVGFIVASVMSFLGWRLNPSGIYHSDLGTNWRFVWDTWISWFMPVFVVGSAVSIPALINHRKLKKHNVHQKKSLATCGESHYRPHLDSSTSIDHNLPSARIVRYSVFNCP